MTGQVTGLDVTPNPGPFLAELGCQAPDLPAAGHAELVRCANVFPAVAAIDLETRI